MGSPLTISFGLLGPQLAQHLAGHLAFNLQLEEDHGVMDLCELAISESGEGLEATSGTPSRPL